jgi:hypothetical protein
METHNGKKYRDTGNSKNNVSEFVYKQHTLHSFYLFDTSVIIDTSYSPLIQVHSSSPKFAAKQWVNPCFSKFYITLCCTEVCTDKPNNIKITVFITQYYINFIIISS